MKDDNERDIGDILLTFSPVFRPSLAPFVDAPPPPPMTDLHYAPSDQQHQLHRRTGLLSCHAVFAWCVLGVDALRPRCHWCHFAGYR